MQTSFNCTQCGKCCHGLHIPLTLREAIEWISRGDRVKVLTEAIPWTDDTLLTDEVVSRKKAITHQGFSGSLDIRVSITLVGYFAHGCPNLDLSKRCNIYKDRPLSCRIYPFELNPAIQLNPSNKLCPPEAWEVPLPKSPKASKTLHQRQPGTLDALEALNSLEKSGTSVGLHAIPTVDWQTREHITSIHLANTNEIAQKNALCVFLEIQSCSLSNDGYLFHLVDQKHLLNVLKQVLLLSSTPIKTDHESSPPINWTIYSQYEQTLLDLNSIGANALSPLDLNISFQEFKSLSAPEA